MEMDEKRIRKKEIMISIVTIIILVIAVIGVTYAAFNFTGTGTRENKITIGELEFCYFEDSNGISIVNAEPISDEVGKVLSKVEEDKGINNGYFDFTIASSITGTAVHYEIYGVDESSGDNAMDSQFVKVYLTKAETEEALTGYTGVVPTFGSLPTSDYDPNGKRIYYGTFPGGAGIHKFRLRIWVADTYTVHDATKNFMMKVNVKASS